MDQKQQGTPLKTVESATLVLPMDNNAEPHVPVFLASPGPKLYRAGVHGGVAVFQVAKSMPSADEYEKGFKDALESIVLALTPKIAEPILGEAITTALDAYANNAGHEMSSQANVDERGSDARDKGLRLRTQALALLQEAHAVDGLKPFTVTHTHRFGESTYVLWAADSPSEEQAQAVLDCEFEPDREETISIEDNFTLEQMTGVAATARIKDILESEESPIQDDSPSP